MFGSGEHSLKPLPAGARGRFAREGDHHGSAGVGVAAIFDFNDRADWLAWLDLIRPESELLRPLPAGSLAVEQVR
jgi:hypothetical protein